MDARIYTVRQVRNRIFLVSCMAATAIGLACLALRFLSLAASDRVELKGTARLLSTTLRRKFVMRGALLAIGGAVLPIAAITLGPAEGGHSVLSQTYDVSAFSRTVFAIALALAIAGEILGRYLFFVSVVPTHMSSPYIPLGSEAA